MGAWQQEGVRYVIGDTADRHVLEEAGIDDAGAVLITTHDDNVNVYLTRYCRRFRPDVRTRVPVEARPHVSTLYRAVADAVLSYAGTGSAAIRSRFRGDETVLVAHDLNLFRVPIPRELAGTTLAESRVDRRAQCHVVAVEYDGEIRAHPTPTHHCRPTVSWCSSGPTRPRHASPRSSRTPGADP